MSRIQRTRLRIRAAPLTSRNQDEHESTSTRCSHHARMISAHSHVYMGGQFISGGTIHFSYIRSGGQPYTVRVDNIFRGTQNFVTVHML